MLVSDLIYLKKKKKCLNLFTVVSEAFRFGMQDLESLEKLNGVWF